MLILCKSYTYPAWYYKKIYKKYIDYDEYRLKWLWTTIIKYHTGLINCVVCFRIQPKKMSITIVLHLIQGHLNNICLHKVEFSITSIWFWKISLRNDLLTTFTSTIYAPFTISTRRLELKGYKHLKVILKWNEDFLFRFRFLKSSFSVNNLSSYQGKYSLQINIL